VYTELTFEESGFIGMYFALLKKVDYTVLWILTEDVEAKQAQPAQKPVSLTCVCISTSVLFPVYVVFIVVDTNNSQFGFNVRTH
jgi:hypothetical protein